MAETQPKKTYDPVAQVILAYKNESEEAKRKRMAKNQDNFACYHHEQDYRHKVAGQSKEFLPKQSMAVEQIASFLQQGLMDQAEWFRIEDEAGIQDAPIKGEEMKKILVRQLQKLNEDIATRPQGFGSFLCDTLKAGCLGSLMIVKVHGRTIVKKSYIAKDRKLWLLTRQSKKKLEKQEKRCWRLQLDLVRQEDYYPDPTGRGLYEIEQVEIDYHELLEVAEANPDKFDVEKVRNISSSRDFIQTARKATETDQLPDAGTIRRVVTLLEFSGTLIEPTTGKVLYRNCRAMITQGGEVIMKPQANDFWHEGSMYVTFPILRVPHSVWHKALMDGPTALNRALNELFNLMFDGGMASVHGIKQVRTNWLQNPAEVADGIPVGKALAVNTACPPNGKVVERVDTGSLDEEALQMFNLADREFMQSSLTNDTRLGSMPQRQVKATEIVASNNSINGVFNGIVTVIEMGGVSRILEKAWLVSAQHMNDLDDQELKDILGQDRAAQIAALTPEERFAATAQGRKFKVFGLTQTMAKIQDFRKYTALLQSISGSEQLLTEFNREYSMTKFLGEIVKSLDIDIQKIKMDEREIQQKHEERLAMAQAMAAEQQKKTQGKRSVEGGANVQSQIPQMGGDNVMVNDGGGETRHVVNQGITSPA